MKYDFDQIIERKNTFSIKWDFTEPFVGVKDVLPLWVADMDFISAKPIVDALVKRALHGVYGYSYHKIPQYLDSVINWMERRHQWTIKPEWILYSPGIVPAINLAIRTFSNVGEKIIIQPPVYYPFMSGIQKNGRIPVLNQLKREGDKYFMDFEDLEKKVKDSLVKILVLCSPHNPVGRVWTREELLRLGDLCLDENILVISDEIHQDLVLNGNKHLVFASLSERFSENCITCTAPSKTFNLAGLHMSNIIISNRRLRDSMHNTLVGQNGLMLANPFGIEATIAAYNEGEEWLKQVLEYIEQNILYIEEFLKEHLPEVTLIKPEGTYLVWLDFTCFNLSNEVLKELMQKKAKVALDEGFIFGAGGDGYERINVASPRSMIEDCMHRILKAVNSLKEAVNSN